MKIILLLISLFLIGTSFGASCDEVRNILVGDGNKVYVMMDDSTGDEVLVNFSRGERDPEQIAISELSSSYDRGNGPKDYRYSTTFYNLQEDEENGHCRLESIFVNYLPGSYLNVWDLRMDGNRVQEVEMSGRKNIYKRRGSKYKIKSTVVDSRSFSELR